jgi:hypothetical protein
MAVKTYLKQYAQKKAVKRLAKAIPWVGGVIALVTIGRTIRDKGLFKGSVDAALDAIPFVGSAKNLAEAARGRDFLPDLRKT